MTTNIDGPIVQNVACVCGGKLASPNLDCERCRLIAAVSALDCALRQIAREYGHKPINNGTATLSGFVRAVRANAESLICDSADVPAIEPVADDPRSMGWVGHDGRP